MKRIGGGSEYGITYDKAAFKSLLLHEATGKRTRPPPGIQNAIHTVNSGFWVGGLIVVCVQTLEAALCERARTQKQDSHVCTVTATLTGCRPGVF